MGRYDKIEIFKYRKKCGFYFMGWHGRKYFLMINNKQPYIKSFLRHTNLSRIWGSGEKFILICNFGLRTPFNNEDTLSTYLKQKINKDNTQRVMERIKQFKP